MRHLNYRFLHIMTFFLNKPISILRRIETFKNHEFLHFLFNQGGEKIMPRRMIIPSDLLSMTARLSLKTSIENYTSDWTQKMVFWPRSQPQKSTFENCHLCSCWISLDWILNSTWIWLIFNSNSTRIQFELNLNST